MPVDARVYDSQGDKVPFYFTLRILTSHVLAVQFFPVEAWTNVL